jgi:hypothetical protein
MYDYSQSAESKKEGKRKRGGGGGGTLKRAFLSEGFR